MPGAALRGQRRLANVSTGQMNSPQAMSDENSVGARRVEPGTIVVVVYDSSFGGIVEPAADSGRKELLDAGADLL